MTYLYLASPYSSPDPSIRDRRASEALAATAWLLQMKRWVYSPIVHCHELAFVHELPTDAEYWQEYNHALLERSKGLLVLLAEGWESSVGVGEEIRYAKELGLAVGGLRLRTNVFPVTYEFCSLPSEPKVL